MKIEQLRQLIAVVNSGSMNEAAKDMYIARSSLSTSMKNLELEFGAPIFDRKSTGVSLTPYGRTVLEQAIEICSRIDFLLDSSSRQDREVQFLSVASMYCTLANDAFIDVYSDHYEHCDFIGGVEHGMLAEVIENIAIGRCEIGTITLFADTESMALHKIEENGLEFHKIIDRPLCAIIGEKNPLYYSEETSLSLADLRDFPYVINYSAPTDYAVSGSLDGRGHKRAEIQISSLGSALRLVSNTAAFLIDTDDLEVYNKFYAANNLKAFPLKDYSTSCKLGWIRSKSREPSPIAEEFIRVLTDKANGK